MTSHTKRTKFYENFTFLLIFAEGLHSKKPRLPVVAKGIDTKNF